MQKLKIGVLREEKTPADKRVPLTPLICSEITRKYSNIDIVVQPSKIRCYSDQEYTSFGITLQEDLSDCDFYRLKFRNQSFQFFSQSKFS